MWLGMVKGFLASKLTSEMIVAPLFLKQNYPKKGSKPFHHQQTNIHVLQPAERTVFTSNGTVVPEAAWKIYHLKIYVK